MKRIYFLLIAFLSFQIKAQYTITSSSNPVPGDVESYLDLDSTGLFLGSSGTSQTWNYSSVTLNGNPLVSNTYVPMSSVPNNTFFSTGTIGLDLGGGSYGVLSNTSTKFEYLGYAEATFTNCWAYSDPYKVYPIPFSYGSIATDTFVLFQPTDTTRGNTITSGDGMGTLQLPTITIPNVLKVRHLIYEVDTIPSNSIMNFTVTMDQYYASVSKFILLEIQTSTMVVTTGTTSSTTYNKNGRIYSLYAPLGIEKIESGKDPVVFPNPVSSGELFISDLSSPEKTKIEIYNTLGQSVRTVLPESGTVKINVSDLAKGIYILRINDKKGIKTERIIIE